MIRVRVSDLEAFRRVLDTPYGDEDALLRAIRGKPDPPSWQMLAGTAWHKVLAEPMPALGPIARAGRITQDGYRFALTDIERSQAHVGPGLHEVTGWRTWDIHGEQVCVRGTADHVRGLVIQDHKTKFSTPDARNYEQSLQWRFYLAIHGSAVFRYNLFHFKDPDESGFCELKDIASFKMRPYVGLDADLREWLDLFLQFAHERSLVPYLQQFRENAT